MALGIAQAARLLSLTPLQLRFGLAELAQALFPLRLQAARDQPVLGIDGVVSALGQERFVAPPLDLQAPLVQRGVMAGFQTLGGDQCGLHAGGLQGRQEGISDRCVDLAAADVEAVLAAPFDDALARAMIAGSGIPAAIVGAQPAATMATDSQALQ